MVSYETEAHISRIALPAASPIQLKYRPVSTGELLGLDLKLKLGGPITVAREGSDPGTTFLAGQLECVGISDRLPRLEPTIEFTIQNISRVIFEDLSFRVRFERRGEAAWVSDWSRIEGELAPGGRIVLTPKLPNEGVGAANVALSIRQGSE